MAQGQGNLANNQLVKGSGCGIREWREDLKYTDVDGVSPMFAISRADGNFYNENGFFGVKADSTTGPAGVVCSSSEGTLATPTATLNGDSVATFLGKGYGATGYSGSGVGGIFVTATQNFTDAAQGAQLKFRVTANGGVAHQFAVIMDQDSTLQLNGALNLSAIETGLTAHAGGGQGSALLLATTKVVHNITVVGSANDSVALPLATGSGRTHIVKNSAAANSMQVYGSGTDTIDGVATGTGVAIVAGKGAIFVDFGSGTWLRVAGA